jgi:hypothetical protein
MIRPRESIQILVCQRKLHNSQQEGGVAPPNTVIQLQLKEYKMAWHIYKNLTRFEFGQLWITIMEHTFSGGECKEKVK